MRHPECPDHGHLVLELARGRLADERAAEAEEVRLRCPACRGWWDAELAGRAAVRLERGVTGGLASFAAPAPRWRYRLVAAAALALVAVGLLLLLPSSPPARTTTAGEVVRLLFDGSEDSRAADLNADGVADAADLATAVARRRR